MVQLLPQARIVVRAVFNVGMVVAVLLSHRGLSGSWTSNPYGSSNNDPCLLAGR